MNDEVREQVEVLYKQYDEVEYFAQKIIFKEEIEQLLEENDELLELELFQRVAIGTCEVVEDDNNL